MNALKLKYEKSIETQELTYSITIIIIIYVPNSRGKNKRFFFIFLSDLELK